MTFQKLMTTLMAALTVSCTCDPPVANFDISEELTDEEWSQLADFWGEADTEEIYCKQLCTTAYRRLSGWEADKIDRCVLDVEIDDPDTGSDGDIPIPISAVVECSGTALEYLCEE